MEQYSDYSMTDRHCEHDINTRGSPHHLMEVESQIGDPPHSSSDRVPMGSPSYVTVTTSGEAPMNIPPDETNTDRSNERQRSRLTAFITIRTRLAPFYVAIQEGMTNIRRSWKILLAAQLLSLLLAGSGATNSILSFKCHLSAPVMQVGLVYFVLSFHLFFLPRRCRRQSQSQSHEYESALHLNNGNDNDDDSEIEVEVEVTDGVDRNDSVDIYVNDDNQRLENESSSEVELTNARNYSDINMRTTHTSLLFNCIPIQGNLKMYIIMSLFDVEANYLTYLSFRYTALTSVSLLDALAIPSAMVFSRCIIKRIYRLPHALGATICIAGILVNILGDFHDEISHKSIQNDHTRDLGGFTLEENGENPISTNDDGILSSDDDGAYPHPIRGDILATLGAILYGLNDVLTERIVKINGGVKEYLGVMGLFGSFICLIQSIITERDDISDFYHARDENEACTPMEVGFLLGACVSFGVVSYVGMSMFLQKSEAALLNLSLLTGDLWAALFVLFVEHIIPAPHFWISLTLVICGVFLYETSTNHP